MKSTTQKVSQFKLLRYQMKLVNRNLPKFNIALFPHLPHI